MPTSRHPPKSFSAYSQGAILLHWLIALAILAQLAMGYTMVRIASIPVQTQFLLFQWHKTIGVLILLLTLARIAWRLMNKPPAKAPMLAIEKITSEIVTFFFYALMLVVPLTGWIMVSASPTAIPTHLFLIENLLWPHLPITADAVTEARASYAHAWLAYSFVLLLFLHIGGALKHNIIDHVPELSRMLPIGRLPHKKTTKGSVTIATLVTLVTALGGILIGQHIAKPAQQDSQAEPLIAEAAVKSSWMIDRQKSSLTYQADFSGQMQSGTVGNWSAIIHFDPTEPEKAHADIVIDASSITYDDAYVAGSLPGKDGFDIAEYPQIRVVLDQFTKEQSDWLATGMITIRGKTKPATLHFTYTQENGHATVNGHAEIDRLAFDLGRQNDADGTWLGKTIRVNIALEADKN